ncbi:MAG: Peptide chain release factor N(5)-glutamine methyltransferase, partial [uncultured Thermomicrobiales bacterium]
DRAGRRVAHRRRGAARRRRPPRRRRARHAPLGRGGAAAPRPWVGPHRVVRPPARPGNQPRSGGVRGPGRAAAGERAGRLPDRNPGVYGAAVRRRSGRAGASAGNRDSGRMGVGLAGEPAAGPRAGYWHRQRRDRPVLRRPSARAVDRMDRRGGSVARRPCRRRPQSRRAWPRRARRIGPGRPRRLVPGRRGPAAGQSAVSPPRATRGEPGSGRGTGPRPPRRRRRAGPDPPPARRRPPRLGPRRRPRPGDRPGAGGGGRGAGEGGVPRRAGGGAARPGGVGAARRRRDHTRL